MRRRDVGVGVCESLRAVAAAPLGGGTLGIGRSVVAKGGVAGKRRCGCTLASEGDAVAGDGT